MCRRKDPIHLRTVFCAEGARSALNAIAADIGIGVVPERLLTGEFEDLKIIETARDRFINQIAIARRLGQRPNFREKEFLRFCREEIK